MKVHAVLAIAAALLALTGAAHARDLQQTFTSGGSCYATATSKLTKAEYDATLDACTSPAVSLGMNATRAVASLLTRSRGALRSRVCCERGLLGGPDA